ncbi:methyltransferase domain-containing protein [Cognatishimia sp. F0-27]|uniref:methyltransferase domain-containing protein n=1 Tax=Cognatishimia sp. F0-27 TaxID=2816855 RepID=UPI001D0C880E|nr:methyltransferase domain-containing protein [Cognatishimia sp. F0-27]MCC1493910.1 methyltransferase domain-containing protein [Cognatishimia sp. F0-27]
MSADLTNTDWDPETYHWFRGLRLQPAVDLMARIPAVPEGDVIDLGCGAGDAARGLRHRFPKAQLIGVDQSPAMLEEAADLALYDRLHPFDIAQWTPAEPPALVFSNAALHWVGDHETLIPALARALAPHGVLAVQMPHQNNAASHRMWHSLVADLFPGAFDPEDAPSILLPAQYHHMLTPMGPVSMWETEYYQHLDPSDDGHPVRHFTQATYARPVLDALDPADQDALCRAYDAVIDKAYPLAADGSVLFPFRRLFFILQRAD